LLALEWRFWFALSSAAFAIGGVFQRRHERAFARLKLLAAEAGIE
jgi:hypothetical protein